MTTTTPIRTELDKQIRPAANQLQKDHDDQLPELRGLIERLGKALEKRDGAMLELYRKPFDEHVAYASQLVARASKLLESLKKLNPKTAEDFKPVEELTAKLSKLETSLKSNLLKLKSLQDQVQDALDANAGSVEQFAEDWAVLKDLLEQHVANSNWRVAQMKLCVDKLKLAVADRDKAKFDEQVKAAAKVRPGNPKRSDVQAAMARFNSKGGAEKLEPGAKDQLLREWPGLQAMFDKTGKLEEEIGAMGVRIGEMQIPPLDAKKAAARLKVPASAMKAFEDALKLKVSAMEKPLDVVGAELKPKLSGKDIVAALKKDKLL